MESRMNDIGDYFERIEDLQEWAVKKAAMYDRKYAKYNDARAWVMAQRYYLISVLCDKALGRAE